MNKNVGTADKTVRYVLAAVFLALGILYSYWWLIGTAIMLITAFTSWCGIYAVLGIKTNKKK